MCCMHDCLLHTFSPGNGGRSQDLERSYKTDQDTPTEKHSKSNMSDWNKGSEKEAFEAGHLKPLDSHNAELLNKTHPYKYVNPEPKELYNLVVIGAGAGGLVTAAQAAKRGAKVALIEKELMGGDCLNIGCVPSKALLACAKRAAAARHSASSKYGVNIKGGDSSTTVDFSYVMKRMRELRAGIATNDSVQRFTKLGVDVFIGTGEFSAEEKKTVLVNGKIKLRYVKACIATGGRAYVPNIEGIDKVPYVTNKTLFNVTEVPRRLAIIGGGPIGCEMAQAFARFGSKVVVFEKHPQPLRREDPDAAKVLIEAMERDGIVFRPNTAFRRVEKKDDEITIFHSDTKTKKEDETKCDLLLIATGRAPNVDGIGLNHVNVKFDRRRGVQVDDFLRTSNPDIYAVGDVCLAEKFTHMAGETGVMVCKNAVFGGQEKYSDRVIPWVTYTQPEIAHVGKYESELKPGTFRTYVNLFLIVYTITTTHT